jgi:phosphate uptake regulator
MANLTLSIPDEILHSARVAAMKRGTTVNAVCREALERLIGPDDAVIAAIKKADEMVDRMQFKSTGPFSRDEIHDERLPGTRAKARR